MFGGKLTGLVHNGSSADLAGYHGVLCFYNGHWSYFRKSTNLKYESETCCFMACGCWKRVGSRQLESVTASVSDCVTLTMLTAPMSPV